MLYFYAISSLPMILAESFFWEGCLFRAEPMACGSSQAMGRIRTTAASLYLSHSNVRSELHLQLSIATAHSNAGFLTP